jgi:hypothetical protein
MARRFWNAVVLDAESDRPSDREAREDMDTLEYGVDSFAPMLDTEAASMARAYLMDANRHARASAQRIGFAR